MRRLALLVTCALPLLGSVALPDTPVTFERIDWFQGLVKTKAFDPTLVSWGPLALSPQGVPRAFARFEDYHSDPARPRLGVFVSAADGSDVRVLARDDQEWAQEAQWSPDGRYVAYTTVRHAPGGCLVADASLWVLEVAGGRRWRLSSEVVSTPQWEPPARRLVYWERTPSLKEGPLPPEGGWPWQVYRAAPPWETCRPEPLPLPRLRGADIRLAQSWLAPLSPDGQRVAYWASMAPSHARDATSLMIESAAGGEARELPAPEGIPPEGVLGGPFGNDCTDLQWSSDGRKLLLGILMPDIEGAGYAHFIVDADTGLYHPMPRDLAEHLVRMSAVPIPPGTAPGDQPAEPPREAVVASGAWIPGTHQVLLEIMEAPSIGLREHDTPVFPQHYAWVTYDTDTGQTAPVSGLPAGANVHVYSWSGRHIAVSSDYRYLYRMR